MSHSPIDVVFTERVAPDAVVFTERSAPSTRSLAPLTGKKNSDDWWLFNSGNAEGSMFTKNADDWQLLAGTVAFAAAQRMGKRDEDEFVLVIEDNS